MENFKLFAVDNQKNANNIIEKLQIISLWQSIGAEINLVGSLKTGLLCKHCDIDFHVYSEKVSIVESFSVILRMLKLGKFKKYNFKNLLNTEEECLEWHLTYVDDSQNEWQIDVIHMPFNSKYHGYFEKVAERILAVMTEEQRDIILKLKYETPDDEKISGIEYYRAVIEGGVKTFKDFIQWRNNNPLSGILEWMP